MKYKVIELPESRYPELCSLFQSERLSPRSFLWQDRNANFFSLYDHFTDKKPTVLALINDNNQVIGSSVFIEMKNMPIPNQISYFYESDFFIHPNYRRKGLSTEFMIQRQVFLGEKFPKGTINYAAEFAHGMFDPFLPHMRSINLIGVMSLPSLQQEIFLTHPAREFQSEKYRVERLHLNTVSFDQWDEFKDVNPNPLMPRMQYEDLAKLNRVDPSASLFKVIENGKTVLATIVADHSRVRKFRIVNKFNIHFQRLEKFWGSQNFRSEADQELKSLLIGRLFGDLANLQAQAALLSAIYKEALERGYHCLYAWHIPSEVTKSLFLEVETYARRILLYTTLGSHTAGETILKLKVTNQSFSLDNHYL